MNITTYIQIEQHEYPARAMPINELNIDRQYNYDITEATDVNTNDDPDLFIGTLMNISNMEDDLRYVTETIGGVPVKFKLDTGSQANLIPCNLTKLKD